MMIKYNNGYKDNKDDDDDDDDDEEEMIRKGACLPQIG